MKRTELLTHLRENGCVFILPFRSSGCQPHPTATSVKSTPHVEACLQESGIKEGLILANAMHM